MSEELIEFNSKMLDSINKGDDWLDGLMNPFTDITDTLGDLSTPVKAIRGLYQGVQMHRFKYFIKAYSKNLRENPFKEDKLKQNEKLKKYLSNPRNKNLIYEIINSASQTNSVYCTLILGYLASEVLSKQEIVSYKHLAVTNFLRNITDFELTALIDLFQRIVNWESKELQKFVSLFKGADKATDSSYYTLSKLKTYNIVKGYPQPDANSIFFITDISSFLWDVIKKSSVIETLKSETQA